MEKVDYGARLLIIRRFRSWTQLQLSVYLHCDQSRISGLERNCFALLFSDMDLAAQALSFSLDVFRRSGEFDLSACLLPMPKVLVPDTADQAP